MSNDPSTRALPSQSSGQDPSTRAQPSQSSGQGPSTKALPSQSSGPGAATGVTPGAATAAGSEAGRGLLFIVSAPSGAGKTTLVERLVEQIPRLRMSRSYTSRAARAGETDGVDYNFVSRPRFEAMIAAGDFLEWAPVFGNLYGTCASETDALLEAGEDVVLVIDVQGARKVRARGVATTTVFVMPPSFDVLEQRLRGRSKDSEAEIQRRLQVARDEVAAFTEYDYVVVNDELPAAVDRLRSIVIAERARLARMRQSAETIVRTFR